MNLLRAIRSISIAALMVVCSPFGSWAQTPPLLKEAVSREYSIVVGGIQTPLVKDISSREVSLFVGVETVPPYQQAASREFSVLVTTPAMPQRITQLTVNVSPTGDTAYLDWSSYNEIAQNDVVHYLVYVSTVPFTTVSNMTPFAIIPAGTFSLTISSLTQWQDHYFAVVAEDVLGGYDPVVNYSAAYVLAPQATSREYALFVGGEPAPPYAQAISRETGILVTTPPVPQRISQLVITTSPTGASATLDWSAYNEIAESDVVRYNIYISNTPFTTVSNLTPFTTVPAGTFSLTVSNLTAWQDHYFAVVPVDGLGGYDPVVNYSAAYVIAAQAASREYSIFVGGSPAGGNAEAVAREVSILVPDSAIPDPVTGLTNNFQADTSVSAYSAIDLDWSSYNEAAQHDVMRYRIYVGSSFYTDVSAMTPYEYVPAGTFRHTVIGLYGGGIYYLAVVAEDALGNWNPTVRSVSAQASIGALGDVQNLAVTCTSNSLHFTWNPPTQVDAFLAHYNVYFNGVTNPIALASSAISYDATNLLSATGYPFCISTVDTFGAESAGVSLLAATLLENPAPIATESFDGIVRLTWTQVEPNNLVKNYAVYESSTPFTNVAGMTPVTTTRGTRGDVSGLVNGTPYYFAVTTVNLIDGENQIVQTVTATPNPLAGSFADLAVTNVASPIFVYAGQTVTVSWAATNIGANSTTAKNGTSVSSWHDRIVLSPDNIYGDADDIIVTNVPHTGGLGVGGSYAAATQMQLATNLAGSFYVFVRVNADAQVYEALDYGSDLGVAPQRLNVNPSVPPTITQQPQDQTVYQGRNASFTVVAQGATPLSYQWRHDAVDVPAGINATLNLTNVQYYDAGSYSIQVSNVAGSTNSTAAMLTVNLPPPDLLTLGIQSPSNVLAGQPVVFSWLVTNAGSSTAVAPWHEKLYLANNSSGTNGTLLLDLVATNSLSASNSVSRAQSIIIPAGLAGSNFWLAVQMDSANQVEEDLGESNNFFVAAQPIHIQSPDLAVVSVASPASVSLGQSFNVSWTVTNSGNGTAIGSLVDRVWLSGSSNSIADATMLASATAPTNSLPATGNYTNNASVSVALNSQTQPGNYWLVVQADALNAVPEANETNNLRSTPLTLTLPPLPDLVVGAVASPPSALARQNIPVSWAVTNVGAADANGVWQESVYLLPDGVTLSEFSTNSAAYSLLGTFSFTNSLPSGQSVARTQNVTIPVTGLANDLRVAVSVDSGNAVVEESETNNAALATNVLQVPLALALYVPVTNVLENTLAPNLNCLVSRNGDLSAPLVVSLDNSGTNHLQTPAGVTLPAGVATAPFVATVLDDGVPDADAVVSISADAAGYLGATSQVTVVNTDQPGLALTLAMPHVVQGQTVTATLTRTPASGKPVVVSIASSTSSALSMPATVTIPVYSNAVTFTVLAVQNTTIILEQSYTITAAAPGYSGATADLIVFNNNTPTLTLSLDRTNINEADGPFAAIATVSRQPLTDQAVTVDLMSTNPGAALPPAQVTIPALQSSAQFDIAAVNDTNVTGPKTALIVAQPLDVLGNPIGDAATVLLTVQDNDEPALNVALQNKVVPKGANPATTGIVSIAAPTTNDLIVMLASGNTNEATVPATVTILAGQTNATFAVASLDDGFSGTNQTVAITASATNYASASDVLTVTDSGLPDLAIASITAPTAAFSGEPLTIGFRLANQGLGPLTNSVTQSVYLTTDPASGSYLLMGTANFSGTLAAGQFVDETIVVPGTSLPSPGTYWVVVSADAGNNAAELNEANNRSASREPTVVSVEYTAMVEAGVTNVVAGTPVPLSGSATFIAGGPAANKPVNILLTVRGLQRILSATTDAGGNFSTVFTPLSTEAGRYTIAAVVPGVTNAPAQDEFTIIGATLNPTPLALTVMEGSQSIAPVTVQNLGEVPITGLAASLTGVAANLNASVTFNTNDLAGQSTVTINVAVTASDSTIRQSSFTVQLTSDEGLTLALPVNVTVKPLVAQLSATPVKLRTTMLRGAQTIYQFTIANLGGAPSGPLTISPPAVPWFSVATTNPLPSLNPGESNVVTLVLTPTADLALGPYTGDLTVNGSGLGLTVPFSFDCVSDAHGALRVHSQDEFTFFAAGSPPLTNASVTLIEPFTGGILATGLTDTGGELLLTNIMEGTYELDVSADQHTAFKGSVTVTAGTTNDVDTFLSRQTVTYIWTVVPTQIQDVTHITVQAEFEANVPAPVVVPSPASIDVASLQEPGQFMDVPLTLANYGLIAVHGVTINLAQSPLYQIDVLATNLGDLPAHGTVTVPMRITRLASPHVTPLAANPCTLSIGIGYFYLCGIHDVSTGIRIPVFNVSGNCGGGGGGGTIVVVGCSGCTGGTIVIPPGQSTPSTCDQCMAKAILECAIGYTPLGNYYSAWNCASGLAEGVSESSIETCVSGGVGALGPVGNTVACLWSFLRCKCNGPLSTVPSCVQQALGGGVKANASVGLGLSPVDPRDVFVARCYPTIEMIQLLLGDTDGRWFSPGSGGAFGVWFNGFVSAIQSGSPSGMLISPDEETNLLVLPRPETVSESDVQATLDRWNLTINNWRAGIYSPTNVPSGGNTNFIDLYAMSELATAIVEQGQVAEAAGYADPIAGFFAAIQDAESKLGGGGTCARVVLQLDQDAVLTRDAFKAKLELNNNGADPMLNVSVNLIVRNAAGQDVTSLFGIQSPTIAGDLTAVDGTGLLQPNGSGSAQWTLIPTLDAAPQTTTNYFVSGSFSYVLNGVAITIPLSPALITVEPSPELYVKYFHQRDVFADDPNTPGIEPSEPYSLAVMVQNKGYGYAHDFKIASAQPTIVDNEKGLLVDFKIIGAQVGNQPVSPSLTVDMGDIPPGGTAIGRWLLTSTLQGLFINYKATFEHVDPLGNPRLSLIQGVEIHEMNHLVHADRAWDDGLPDFLVNDMPDFNDLPDTLYLSDGGIQPVSVVEQAGYGPAVSSDNLQTPLSVNFPAGFTYVQVPDPGKGAFPLLGVVRPDGSSLLPENFWTTDRTFIGLAQPPVKENMLHLFDYHTNAGPVTYTLVYGAPTNSPQTNQPVSSVFALPVQSPPAFGVVWSGASYIGGAPIAYYDIYVSDNGGPFTVWQSHTTATSALFDGTVGHTYAFYSVATDTAGRQELPPSQPQAQTVVALNSTPPALSVVSNITLNAGETLSLNVTASEPNPQHTLTFSLGGGAPTGMAIDPSSGQITWATSPTMGGSTNLIAVIATDNGQPPLSATGTVQVVVVQNINPPTLAPIADYFIYEAQLLTVTNSATDNNLPPRPLTFSLGAGAPTNSTIDPVTGVFQWRPTVEQARGPHQTRNTNVISVAVSDNGTPPLSATQQFTVVVSPINYQYTLSLGSTNVLVGQTSSVPMNLMSTLPLTNITALVQVPPTELTNLTLLSVSPEILSTLFQAVGTNQYAISLSLNPALSPGDSRILAQLGFTAAQRTNSAIAHLLVPQLSAVQSDGQTAAKPGAFGGRVFIIGREPILDAWLGTNAGRRLTLFGKPGASYEIGYKTNLLSTNWLPVWRVPMTNQYQVFGVNPAAPQIFYRAWEFFAEPPTMDLGSVARSNVTLLLYGKSGTNYLIEATTNLSLTNNWFVITNATLTNSFKWIDIGGATNPAKFFRAQRP